MVIRRCAWHRQHHGYGLLFGVMSWRGFKVQFTDGMCQECAARMPRDLTFQRAGYQLRERRRCPAVLVPRLGVAALAVTALVLAARPLDEAFVSRGLLSEEPRGEEPVPQASPTTSVHTAATDVVGSDVFTKAPPALREQRGTGAASRPGDRPRAGRRFIRTARLVSATPTGATGTSSRGRPIRLTSSIANRTFVPAHLEIQAP